MAKKNAPPKSERPEPKAEVPPTVETDSAFVSVESGTNGLGLVRISAIIIIAVLLLVFIVWMKNHLGGSSEALNTVANTVTSVFTPSPQKVTEQNAEPVLPTSSHRANIEVGTEWVEIPIFLPIGKKVMFNNYRSQDFEFKDRDWNFTIPVITGNVNIRTDEHIFRPCIRSLMPNGKKIDIEYYVFD